MLIIRKKLVPTIADTYFSLNGWIACLDNSLESGSPLIRSIQSPNSASALYMNSAVYSVISSRSAANAPYISCKRGSGLETNE